MSPQKQPLVVKMSAANITKTTISNQTANDRLGQIQGHVGAMGNEIKTAFSAELVPQAPEDPLFGLMAAYRKDTDEKKVDLGIGAYRDDNAKPWVLPVVKEVSNTSVGTSPCYQTGIHWSATRASYRCLEVLQVGHDLPPASPSM